MSSHATGRRSRVPSTEALWWSLFAAGGVMSAMFLPVIIVVTGLAMPFISDSGPERYERLRGLLSWWPVRGLLIVVISLTFFHCAHRMRHLLMDVGIRSPHALLVGVFYGCALLCVVATVWVVVRL